MTAAKKKLFIAGCILGLAIILCISALGFRIWIANQVTDKLSAKLAPMGITVNSELSSFFNGPTCFRKLSLILANDSSLSMENVCVQNGLFSLATDEPDVEISSEKLAGNITIETISEKLASLNKVQTHNNFTEQRKIKSAKISIQKVAVSFGNKGKNVRWDGSDLQIDYKNGNVSVQTEAIPLIDLAKAPVPIRNIPNLSLNGNYSATDKAAHIQITATPALEIGFAHKEKSGIVMLSGTELILQRDGLSLKLNQIELTDSEEHIPAPIRLESIEISANAFPKSLKDIQKVQLNTPEISLELGQILSQKQLTEHPVIGALIGFWQQEAGAYLGTAPNNSVRREDIIKNKKVIRKNPISKEKLALIRTAFDEFQQRITKWPAIEIQNGKINITNGTNHYDFSAISFNTAELFQDTQKFHLAFSVRDASADFDIKYETDSPFPEVSFDVQSMEASDFLRIINMPIPDKSKGQVSLNLKASMSDDNFNLSGNISLKEFAFYNEKISPNQVSNVNASASLNAMYSFKEDLFEIRPVELTSGPITAQGFIKISNVRSDPVIEFELGSKDIPCSDIPKAIPDGFLPTITELRFTGSTFSPKITGKIPWKNPLTATLKESGFENRCIPTSVVPHFPEEINDDNYTFTTDYTYFAESITVGPGTKTYVPLDEIPPYVKAAMFLTEDKRFFDHGPLRIAFIERAIRLNLNQRSYVYGGSTIAQQLTKNLFLNRTKNLARKLEEAFIAWRLESIVPRLRIFELYINVIEFGPDIYGIHNASKFYFGKRPKDLTPLEGAFLASLKVSPSKGGRFYKTGFAQNGNWWHKRMRYILKTLAENGYISVSEVIAAYNWTPEFDYPTVPGDPRQKWLNQYGEYLKDKAKQKIADADSK